jgi:hypothetical protein
MPCIYLLKYLQQCYHFQKSKNSLLLVYVIQNLFIFSLLILEIFKISLHMILYVGDFSLASKDSFQISWWIANCFAFPCGKNCTSYWTIYFSTVSALLFLATHILPDVHFQWLGKILICEMNSMTGYPRTFQKCKSILCKLYCMHYSKKTCLY